MGSSELKTDASQRWVLYSRDTYEGGRIFLTAEQKQAVEEGKKFAQRAYVDVWARDAALVQRVRAFLGDNFYWHGRLSKKGTSLEVIQTLQSMIRGDSVVLIAEKSRLGGSVAAATPTPEKMPSFRESLMTSYGMTYEAASDYIDRYNAMVDRGREVAARYASQAAPSFTDVVSDVPISSTLLGNVGPFEYIDSATEDDVIEVAGLGNRGDMYACDVISAECKGSVLREFSGQYLNSTLNDIQSDAQDGVKEARKALKLLDDTRFKK